MPSLEVRLSPLFGQAQSPVGIVEVEVPDVWRVDVFDDALEGGRLDANGEDQGFGKLHIGMIGRQDGANFCENHQFGKFTTEQRAVMVAQIKALHGNASTDAPMELPEDISEIDEDADDDDDGVEDTDLE